MLNRIRYFAFPVAIAIVFGFVCLTLSSSEGFQDCIQEGQRKTDQKSSQNQIADKIMTFVIYKRCVGQYVEHNAEGIIALFTIFLASATLGLWVVTWLGIPGQRKETKILQRAYLNITPAGIEPYRSLDGRLSCDVYFEN